MAHKYVSLKDAAEILGMTADQLNELRESGELRGFADRGTWKFRQDTIEEYARSRSLDSDPDIPIIEADRGASDLFGTKDLTDADVAGATSAPDETADNGVTFDFGLDEDDSSTIAPAFVGGSEDIGATYEFGDDDDALQETVVSDDESSLLAAEDSGAFGLLADPDDSGINLVPDGSAAGVELEADSGILLPDESGVLPSDSGVLPDESGVLPNDSGVIAEDDAGLDQTFLLDEPDSRASLDDSEVTLQVREDSGLNLDEDDDEGSEITLDFDNSGSGVALESEDASGLTLDDGGDSGIALDLGGDSGIALDLGGDSGITLENVSGESGIALDLAGDSSTTGGMDSGIALELGDSGLGFEGDDDLALDFAPDSQFAEADTLETSLDDDDRTIDFKPEDSDPTIAMPAGARADSEFNLGTDEDSQVDASDEFDEADGLGELDDDGEWDDEEDFDAADELEEVDDFDEDVDPFDEDDAAAGYDDDFEDDFATPPAAKEASWGAVTAVGLVLCTCAMCVTLLITWQSMRVMWTGQAPDSVLTPVVDGITGLIP